MAIDAVRQLWAEPRVPNAPKRVWRDWVLVGALVLAAVLEAILRTNLGWPLLALMLGSGSAITMLWRRSHPLAVIAVAFAAHAVSDVVTFFGAERSAMLYSSAALAILPYALVRWASGRACAIGMSMMIVAHVPHGPNAVSNLGEAAGGALFFLLPAALGAAVRYRTTARLRETDQVKLREREQLARELHDTVAHHVSAIIIQAQAGRTVAATNPAAAVNVLEVIEAEASRTLAEMRFMVSALRQGEDPDLTPQRGVADITRLARPVGTSPTIDVQLSGGLDDLRPSVGAAVYRIAQESITNAVRHARHATRVAVVVAGDDENVRLTVHDDGDPATFGTNSSLGYGLIGMKERTKLLGGTLEAGPAPDRGWTITAVLPRNGATT
ncbi:MAG: sensor histidine kinase [Actinomycetota bacterium]